MKIEKTLLKAIQKDKHKLADKFGLHIQTINRWIRLGRMLPFYHKMVSDHFKKK